MTTYIPYKLVLKTKPRWWKTVWCLKTVNKKDVLILHYFYKFRELLIKEKKKG